MAVTDLAAFIVTWQAPVPVQAPLQPAKTEPAAGVAAEGDDGPGVVGLGAVGPAADAGGRGGDGAAAVARLRHGQGVGRGLRVKVAVTDLAASMVTWQAPVPVQAPLQPAKVEPAVGGRG